MAISGCAHHSAEDIVGHIQPLTDVRDRVVANVSAAKSSFDFLSVDQLKVCYGDLAAKVGDYTGYLTGAIQTGTFDAAVSQSDATGAAQSSSAFNDCQLKLERGASPSPASPLPLVNGDWVAGFEKNVEAYWTTDGGRVRSLSADVRQQLITKIQSATAWPKFDDIPKATAAPP